MQAWPNASSGVTKFKALVLSVALGFGLALTAPVLTAEAATKASSGPSKVKKASTSKSAKANKSKKRKKVAAAPSRPTDPAKDAALIIDGRTGNVLYERNADAKRHPASLTKIMTLYMLFDALKAGKVTMETPLKVSHHAASQKPTKLYLKPGETIPVEAAIKALVVLSANDVAATVGEALGGTESRFAEMMTQKARQIGMRNSQFYNASGLPDMRQITTARDMAILAQRVAYEHPQLYHYFSTVSFTWKGRSRITHNNLIGSYEGADGIKTGYTGASGFNLVSSVVRNGDHVIGVVLGGYTARLRDGEMRRLLTQTFNRAKTEPTLLARAPVPWQQRTANSHFSPVAAGFNMNGSPSTAIAQANPDYVARRWTMMNMRANGAEELAPVPAAKPGVEIANNYPQALVGTIRTREDMGEGDIPDDARRAVSAMGARAWTIQIGAYATRSIAESELQIYSRRSGGLLNTAQHVVVPVESRGHTLYRARFGPMAERDARETCAKLTEIGQTCFATASSR